MKWFIRWLAHKHILEAYMRGWKAGVNQEKYESDTSKHGHQTYFEYWGEEE